MDTQLASMPVIDVDTHFTEPPDLWTSRAPRKFKDKAPRVIRDAEGRDQWIVDDDIVFGPMGFCVIKRDAEKEAGELLSTLKEDALAKQKVALSKGKTAVKALQKKASVRIDAVAKEIAEGILDTEERRF